MSNYETLPFHELQRRLLVADAVGDRDDAERLRAAMDAAADRQKEQRSPGQQAIDRAKANRLAALEQATLGLEAVKRAAPDINSKLRIRVAERVYKEAYIAAHGAFSSETEDFLA